MTKELNTIEDALICETLIYLVNRAELYGIRLFSNELRASFLDALADWVVDARRDFQLPEPRRGWLGRSVD